MITGCWIDRGKGKEMSRVYVCVCVQLIDSLLWKEGEKRVKERERKTLVLFFPELHNSRGVWAVLWSSHSDKLSLHPGWKKESESEEGLGQVRTPIICVCLLISKVSHPPDTWQEEEGSQVFPGKVEGQIKASWSPNVSCNVYLCTFMGNIMLRVPGKLPSSKAMALFMSQFII